MPPRVTLVRPLEGCRPRLAFSGVLVREVDVPYLMRGPLGEPLRDPNYFRQVRIDDQARTVVWPNGLVPDPGVLHGDFEPVETEGSQQRRAQV